MADYSVMVFGGSGNIESIEPFREPLSDALTEADDLLRKGHPSIEAALRAATILEDHPRLNSGHGSALNADGKLSMEAAIMNGADLSVGAVAGIDCIENPILLAELIRRDPTLVKLIGAGAVAFALDHEMPLINPDELITERQRTRWQQQLASRRQMIDGEEEKMGTIGVVVRDLNGDLAAATSTGGLMGVRRGRVGDTSTIGAGTYANRYVAASATGNGEYFVRANATGLVATLVEVGLPVDDAVAFAIARIENIGGKGGMIVVNRYGELASAKTTSARGLAHGAITSDSELVVSLDPADVTVQASR